MNNQDWSRIAAYFLAFANAMLLIAVGKHGFSLWTGLYGMAVIGVIWVALMIEHKAKIASYAPQAILTVLLIISSVVTK